MAALTVRCKACDRACFTGISTGWVERPMLGPHEVRCDACGAIASYHGSDFAPAPA